VETLVVMAIIMTLAGIIYASLGPAREKARQSVCLTNLHQIGAAIALYRSDYDGGDVTGGKQSFDMLGLPPSPSALRPYIRDKRVWKCPDENWPAIMENYDPKHPFFSSYEWGIAPEYVPGPKFSDGVARRGEQLVILDDVHHNTYPLGDSPTQLVIVLRLGGAVQAHYVDRRLHASDW
jgi:type II secretory pathway pseudopilin PulG